jgi:Kae1-associated kinase Bud32
MKIIARGAEAIIEQEGDEIIKKRIKKSYRISEIDEKLRKLRTRQESRLLEKAFSVTRVPKVIKVDEKTKEVVMQFIKGQKLAEHLNSFSLEKQKEICKEIGKEVAKFHDIDVIHGDLTTSNMILAKECGNDVVYFIDFGLGFKSSREEDKAVDIHLLKQALEAKHYMNWQILFKEFLEGYKTSKTSEKVLKQLKKVEARGRYKEQA